MNILGSRPARFRPILTMVLVLVVLLSAWLGLEIYFAVTAKPNPTIDYGDLARQHVESIQADRTGENTWPVLLEALAMHRDSYADLQDPDTGVVWGEGDLHMDAVYDFESLKAEILQKETFEDERAKRLTRLEAHRRMGERVIRSWDDIGLTRRLDEIAASGKAVRPMPDTTQTMMIDMLLPELGDMRSLARALRSKMHLAAEKGEWDSYAEAFRHGLTLSRIASDHTWLIERLVGTAIRALMLGQLQRDLIEHRLPAEACEKIAEVFASEWPRPPAQHALEGELLMQLDTVQWTHDRRGRIIFDRVRMLDGSAPTGGKILNVASIAFPRRHTTEAWFRAQNERMNEFAELSPAEKRKAQQQCDFQFAYDGLIWNQPLGGVLLPALEKYMQSEDQIALHESGVRTMLAIERFRHASGRLPADLGELVPQWLEAVPEDPFAETPASLVYRVLEGEAEGGPGYILYSVAYDGRDDGGVPAEKSAYDALRASYPGSDFILSTPAE